MSNIQDFSQPGVPAASKVVPPTPSGIHSVKPGLGAQPSDIQQSESVIISPVPYSDTPTLPEIDKNELAILIAILKILMDKDVDFGPLIISKNLTLFTKIEEKTAQEWGENIKEVTEQTREIYQSYAPSQKIPIEQKMAPQISIEAEPNQLEDTIPLPMSNPQKGQTTTMPMQDSQSKILPQSTPVSIPLILTSVVHYFERLKILDKVPTEEVVVDPENPEEKITIPLKAGAVISSVGLLAFTEKITSEGSVSYNPVRDMNEFINKFQPIFPNLIPELIPIINLMVMPLIYYTFWDETFGKYKKKDRKNYADAIKKFVKSIIKMVSDSSFPRSISFSNRGKSATVMKLVLSTVALSLLYSLEVGKVVGEKFWGMEPEELRGMLLGKISITEGKEADQLKIRLLKLIKGQLADLEGEEKSQVLEVIFEYLMSSHDVEAMLDPAKVFSAVLSSMATNTEIVTGHGV